MTDIKKVHPTISELEKVESELRCTEEGCLTTFTCSSNLTLHLVKTHKKTSLMLPKEVKQFHCPEEKCIYYSKKFFKNMKDIKQHYRKVHMVKQFICDSCHKGFLSEQQKISHTDYCGVTFKCNDCDAKYASYEALITHARRKSHKIFQKSAYKINSTISDMKPARKIRSNKITPSQNRILLPKAACQIIVLHTQEKCIEKQVVEKNSISTQTDSQPAKQKAKRDRANTKRNSQHTQTICRKKPKLSVQTTQTVDNSFCNGNNHSNNILTDSSAKKSIKTQTNGADLLSFNNLFTFDDVDFNCDIERTSSSTQTYKEPSANSDGTRYNGVSENNSIIDFNQSFDSNFFNCNTETQTDFFFDEDLLNCNYYSDTHTQTCEEMLLGDIGFTNIETQTAMHDVCSVESQTLMSHTKKMNSGYRDISHIETQTDLEFKKMLEEINS